MVWFGLDELWKSIELLVQVKTVLQKLLKPRFPTFQGLDWNFLEQNGGNIETKRSEFTYL